MKTLIPKTTVWYIFVALIAPKLLLILYYALCYKSLFFLEVWEENSIFLLKSFVISYSVGQFVPFEKLSKGGIIAIALLCLLILPIINIYNFWRIYDEFNIQNYLDYLGLNIIIGILLGVILHRIAKKEKAIPPMNQITPRIRAILYIVFSFWIGAIYINDHNGSLLFRVIRFIFFGCFNSRYIYRFGSNLSTIHSFYTLY